MDTFEQVWESSRNNSLSWLYPAMVGTGICLLVILSFMRNRLLNLFGTLLVLGGCTYLATGFAGQAIQEKWRLRKEWALAHPTQMTEQRQTALISDGANLTMGPLISGFQAFVVFTIVVGILYFARTKRAYDHANSVKPSE